MSWKIIIFHAYPLNMDISVIFTYICLLIYMHIVGLSTGNLCPDVCVKDSETDPFRGASIIKIHTHIDGSTWQTYPILRDLTLNNVKKTKEN